MQSKFNGINVADLTQFVEQVGADKHAGLARFEVETIWQGGTRTQAKVCDSQLGSTRIARDFLIDADEPDELLGQNTAPNPQELLLAALNACMSVGYVANAAAMGVEINALKIRSHGTLDLRGFLGLDERINPGYDAIQYIVDIASSAQKEKLEKLHAIVQKTSPNFHNMARAISMHAVLNVSQPS